MPDSPHTDEEVRFGEGRSAFEVRVIATSDPGEFGESLGEAIREMALKRGRIPEIHYGFTAVTGGWGFSAMLVNPPAEIAPETT
jgi:hypothetical protein